MPEGPILKVTTSNGEIFFVTFSENGITVTCGSKVYSNVMITFLGLNQIFKFWGTSVKDASKGCSEIKSAGSVTEIS